MTFSTSNWIPVVSLVNHITSTPFRMMTNNGKYAALFSLCLDKSLHTIKLRSSGSDFFFPLFFPSFLLLLLFFWRNFLLFCDPPWQQQWTTTHNEAAEVRDVKKHAQIAKITKMVVFYVIFEMAKNTLKIPWKWSKTRKKSRNFWQTSPIRLSLFFFPFTSQKEKGEV